MSEKVVRYDCWADQEDPMERHHNGEWVRYSDYEKLLELVGTLCPECIEECEALKARVEELERYKAERERIDKAVCVDVTWHSVERSINKVAAKNARLREALEKIATLEDCVGGHHARAALKETEDD